jgi:hypothetical protein
MKHNFPYEARTNTTSRKEAVKRIHDSELVRMIWYCLTMFTSFVGYVTILYLIVRLFYPAK